MMLIERSLLNMSHVGALHRTPLPKFENNSLPQGGGMRSLSAVILLKSSLDFRRFTSARN